MKIFETAQAAARKQYASAKAEKIVERRAALDDNDEKRYEMLAVEMASAEENLTNEMLMKILEIVDIDQ